MGMQVFSIELRKCRGAAWAAPFGLFDSRKLQIDSIGKKWRKEIKTMNRTEFTAVFKHYASAYDLTDAKILLKYIHTDKVAQNCERIARSLNLPGEDVELAWQIGMLHDIGRFEQLRRFDTFNDAESIDHAEFGADLLFRRTVGSGCNEESLHHQQDTFESVSMGDALIAHYDIDRKNYSMIELAIRCHNRYRIPENLSERETMFCNIIRDADKIDIWRANYETGMEAIYNVTTQELKECEITPEVYAAFLEKHAVLRSLKRTPIDHLVGHLSLYWELVFPESRVMAKEQGYLMKLSSFESENPQTQQLLERMRDMIK